MSINGETTIHYNDQNLMNAIKQVESFSANFGGTEIYEPIQNAFINTPLEEGMQKRVFLLTDG